MKSGLSAAIGRVPRDPQAEARAWLTGEGVAAWLQLGGYEPEPVLARRRQLLEPAAPPVPGHRELLETRRGVRQAASRLGRLARAPALGIGVARARGQCSTIV